LKKFFHISKKLTKFSIYLGLIIFVLTLTLDLNIKYFKNLIEERLSLSTGFETRVENLSLGYDFDSINIQVLKITFLDESKFPSAEVSNLHLELTYGDLFKESKKFNSLAIDTLKINSSKEINKDEKKSINDLSKFLTSLRLFQKIRIEQTLISSKKEYEIGEINFISNSDNIDFYVNRYPLNLIYENSNDIAFDLNGKVSFKNLEANEVEIPINIATEDFGIDGRFQLKSNNLKFSGHSDQVDAEKSLKYFPQNPSNSQLIKNFANAIQSGSLNDIRIEFEKNLQTNSIIRNKFDSRINIKELNFLDSKLKLKEYSGQISIDKDNLSIEGNGSLLNKLLKINTKIPSKPRDNRIISINFSDQNSNLFGSVNYLENQNWDFSFSDGNKFSGDFTIPKTVKDIPEIIIENLVIPDEESNEVILNPSDIPKVTLISKRIKVGNHELPEFEIQLVPTGNILLVSYLKLKGFKVDNNPIVFSGAWLAKDKTIINSKLSGENLEKLLSAIGFEKKIKGGKYDLDIRLYCDCAPWQVKLDSISGEIKGDVQEGIFTDEDPSIGRVFSLLNIDSISRRLRLNVDDLVSKGFVYDAIKGRAVINDSKIKIDYFNIDSTSNHISIEGNSNLDLKTYDLQADVRPEIADSVPIATYLAGGGLAGLGVWLADKTIFQGDLLNEIVDKIIEFKYVIKGPWSAPIITENKKIL